MGMKKNNNIEANITKACEFCEFSVPLIDESQVLCKKFGIVSCNYSCKKFIYDLLKRIPKVPAQLIIPNADDILL